MAGLAAGHALLDDDLDVVLLRPATAWWARPHRPTLRWLPSGARGRVHHGERAATWGWVDRLGLATVHWAKQDDSWVRRRRPPPHHAPCREVSPALDVTPQLGRPRPRAAPSNRSATTWCGSVSARAARLRTSRLRHAEGEHALPRRHRHAGRAGCPRSGRRGDYRILEGYGAIVEALGVGLDIHTQSVVSRVVGVRLAWSSPPRRARVPRARGGHHATRGRAAGGWR